MGERKVQSKYFPPDFDPTRIVPSDCKQTRKVRMMMPMSVQCNECNEFIYNGKKFNAMIEPVQDEDYLGIRLFRLAVRCPQCSNNITIKTDPANCDYVCESGATRNFEPWRQFSMDEAEKEAARERAKMDAMTDLETKQYDMQKEMQMEEQLEDLQSLRARQGLMTQADLLDRIMENRANDRAAESKLSVSDEALVEAAFAQPEKPPQTPANNNVLSGPLLGSGRSLPTPDSQIVVVRRKKKKTAA